MEHSAEYNNAHLEKRCAANGKQVGSFREASEKQVGSFCAPESIRDGKQTTHQKRLRKTQSTHNQPITQNHLRYKKITAQNLTSL